MKPQHLKSLLPTLLMAASFGTASAYACDTQGVVGTVTPQVQARVDVVAGHDLDLVDDLPANFRVLPDKAFAADNVDPAPVGAAARSVDEHGDDLDSEATAPVDQDWAPLEHLGLTHHHLNTSGGDTVGGGVKVDTDVQYSLTNKWVMGSELESHHADPLSARADVDQYTFGLHINL
jgi:hypothetical protein